MPGLIVHEWVAKTGGSENVLEQIVEAFPDSDLQVLWNDDPERFSGTVYETWLARTPLRKSKALALPFLPATWRTIKANQKYEWILASSHLFAHHAHLRNQTESIQKYSYIHTPARYIWEPSLDDRGNNLVVKSVGAMFKTIDRRRAQESHKMAANSQFTRERIRRVWDRDADVIYPPVEINRIVANKDWRNALPQRQQDDFEKLPSHFILGASRFVPYKRLDLVIDAGNATGIPVVIAGRGPEESRLRAIASNALVPVHFVISPTDEYLYALYQQSTAFIFPAVEDFGIMPVEAMAAGTPVIVPSIGGAAESASILQGGATIAEYSKEGWMFALDQVQRIDRVGLPDRSKQMSNERFRVELAQWVGVEGH